MKKSRFAAALVVPALVALTLAACGDDDGGSGGSTHSPAASGGNSTGCLIHKTWKLDVADAASQVGAYLATKGLHVVSSTGSGSQTFKFTQEGQATSTTDLTYIITVDESGHALVVTQKHTGDTGGGWAWLAETDGSSRKLTFTNWDSSSYAVQNTVAIDGVSSSAPVDLPDDSNLNGTNMAVTCSGNHLTTKVDASPFTQKWTAG
jgi:hypothetical protein